MNASVHLRRLLRMDRHRVNSRSTASPYRWPPEGSSTVRGLDSTRAGSDARRTSFEDAALECRCHLGPSLRRG